MKKFLEKGCEKLSTYHIVRVEKSMRKENNALMLIAAFFLEIEKEVGRLGDGVHYIKKGAAKEYGVTERRTPGIILRKTY